MRIAGSRSHILLALSLSLSLSPLVAQEAAARPWSNKQLPANERAALVLKQMTLDEKIALIHGEGMPGEKPGPTPANGGAGLSPGVPRLGIPAIQMADAAYGVTRSAANGRYSTALPSDLAAASSWDPEDAYAYGKLIATELRAQGYNMSLGGGVNVSREPRDGRTFEYMGEDPLLAGTLVGHVMRGEQDQHIIGDVKHYAVNDQESGRNAVNANIDKRSMREADLFAFETVLDIAHPGAVMCSYNRVNGDYACENSYLLGVLKRDFNFQGFVVSDWGGTHSAAKASHAGLDMEQPDAFYYGDKLRQAVNSGEVSSTELDDHVLRILRSEFTDGLVDYPVERSVVDVNHGYKIAQQIAEKSIVLLQNRNNLLPLDTTRRQTIAVIGGYADRGVLLGGGSAQVDPAGGTPVPPPPIGDGPFDAFIRPAWLRDAPLEAIRQSFPNAKVVFDSGDDPTSAAALARTADAVIVFGYQWTSEAMDLKTLALAPAQNALIAAVTSANPHTVVVLESSTAVLMPWASKAGAIVEAWYPGSRGAEALANILSGVVNPTGKLAMTFPLADADLPHPTIVQPPPASQIQAGDLGDIMRKLGEGLPAFQTYYDEKLEVGYKWYDAKKKEVLFPFGHGLSYTTYTYSDLHAQTTATGLTITFTVRNTGSRAGDEIAQVYAALPTSAGEPPHRLVGWTRLALAPGEHKLASIVVDRKLLSIFDEKTDTWKLVPGEYTILAGASSRNLPLQQSTELR